MATRGSQIENRNYLAPVGFKFNLQRSPGVAYFCNQANIPDISLGVAIQPNPLRDIPTPGDKMEFGDLNLRYKRFGDQVYSDGTLQILSSNMVAKFNVFFKDLWPYQLTTLSFDATDTDIEYFTADVSFKYTMYNLKDTSNNDI